jgi:hypothetical protein
VVRPTKRHSNKDVDRPPDDGIKEIVEPLIDDAKEIVEPRMDDAKEIVEPLIDDAKEIVEPRMDDYEVVVDGFQRLSVLGLEVMTLDGPLRARIVRNLEGERQRDHRPG